ncbi:transcriptional regulator [Enterococcus faecalis]|nr:transcriptional regulator [Enterococcus faecalis]EGO9034955.1 transcriptional regulator [Enterococcus faecalis]
MAKEKIDTEFQNVTIRVPKELYAEYKVVLKELGKIPTYAVINHMKEVIEKYKAEAK